MAASEVELGRGLASVVRGEVSVEAEAAMQLVAETVLWWRLLARNPGKGIAVRAPEADDGASAAERAYYAAKGLR